MDDVVNLEPDGVENLIPDAFDDDVYVFGKSKRTRKQREEDLIMIARMLAKRVPQQKICDQINSIRPYKIGRSQIAYDVKSITEALKKKHSRSMLAQKSLDLEIIEYLEGEVMEAWERSKADQTSVKLEKGNEGSQGGKTTHTKEKRDGDPVWIRCMILLLERRSKLIGLDAPAKTSVDANIKTEHGLNVDSLAHLRQAFRKRVELEIMAANGAVPALNTPPQ